MWNDLFTVSLLSYTLYKRAGCRSTGRRLDSFRSKSPNKRHARGRRANSFPVLRVALITNKCRRELAPGNRTLRSTLLIPAAREFPTSQRPSPNKCHYRHRHPSSSSLSSPVRLKPRSLIRMARITAPSLWQKITPSFSSPVSVVQLT